MVKFGTKELSVLTVFAALYAIGVITLAPISYGIVQCRVADSLIPLSAVFGWPVAIGVSLGCLVANAYGGLGIIDIVFGTIANFAASALAYWLRKRPVLACLAATAVITLIVGGYLWMLFNVPLEFSVVGVFIGSLISINVLGYLLVKILKKSGALKRYEPP